MSGNVPIVVGLGEILWDMLPGGKQLGGAPANFAYHAGLLGADACIVSSVGSDDMGQEILGQLNALKLKTDYIAVDPVHPTGTVSVKLDPDGHPEYIIHQDVAWDFIPFPGSTKALAGKADAVCFGSLAQRCEASGTTVISFLESTRDDCLRVFDINLRQKFYSEDIIRRSLELSSVLKLNDDELQTLAEMVSCKGDEKQVARELITAFSLDLVALTMGENGSLLLTPGEESFFRTEPVEVEDTVGAGDSFTAALAAGLLKGLPLREIHRHAAELSAYVCTRKGATPDVPGHLL
jgi:fructokinase